MEPPVVDQEPVAGTGPPAAPVPRVRATTRDHRGPWAHRVTIVAVVVVVVLAGAVTVAWWQDRSNRYPGFRNADELANLQDRVEPPTNAVVDEFRAAGPLGHVGSWPWRPVTGGTWRAEDRYARAPATGGVTVIDPGHRRVIAQVDLFRPVRGAGLVFRWQDADDHWSVEVAPGRSAWELVRTLKGRRTIVDTISEQPQGGDVRVILTATSIEVDINGGPRYTRHNTTLAAATAVGLQAPTDETRFADFAVLPT